MNSLHRPCIHFRGSHACHPGSLVRPGSLDPYSCGKSKSRTARYGQLTLTSYTLAHLLLAVLLLALFAWMVLRADASSWAAWIFLLVGLFISLYPTIYFTPVGRLFSSAGGAGQHHRSAYLFSHRRVVYRRHWRGCPLAKPPVEGRKFAPAPSLPLLLSACVSPASLTPETAAIGFLSTEHQAYRAEKYRSASRSRSCTGSRSKNTSCCWSLFEVKILQPTGSNASRCWIVTKTRIKHGLPLALAMQDAG